MAVEKRLQPHAEIENLPGLFTRLGDDVMQLFDTKFSLLKVEVKEDVNAFLRDSVLIAAGGLVAIIGFALVNVAVAFGISTLFANSNLSQAGRYAVGFVITGLIYLIVGTAVALAMKARLARQSLVPERTIDELRKDSQWLKAEL
jgi:uncharacterized membrane protein YqjE